MNSGAATQIASRKFDERFFVLSAELQARLQARVDSFGVRLAGYPHFRMQGADTYRLRVGDYRIIYQFDIRRNEIQLSAWAQTRRLQAVKTTPELRDHPYRATTVK